MINLNFKSNKNKCLSKEVDQKPKKKLENA